MKNGEMVMLGIAPRINGYAGTFGHTVPVSGEYTPEQKKCLTDMIEVMRDVKNALKIGYIFMLLCIFLKWSAN